MNTKINYIPQFTDFPASEADNNEKRREEIFQKLHRNVQNSTNFLINGKNFTNKIFDASSSLPKGSEEHVINEKKYILLPAGFDGVIFDYSQENGSIILPTADCASVSFDYADAKKMGILHAGYKGTAAGIIDNLFQYFNNDENFAKNTQFDLSPMAGDDFELDTTYYLSLFEDYLKKHGLNAKSKKFFKEKENGKCCFSLSKIIYEILLSYNVPKEHISVAKIDTTNPKNDFHSFRLFSNYQSLQKLIQDDVENFELLPPNVEYFPPRDNSNYYEKLIKNPNHKVNSVNGRMATIIKNI